MQTENEKIKLKLLKEICDEENIVLTSFSDDYYFNLKKEAKNIQLYKNISFQLNEGNLLKICKDKVATSEFLTFYEIPNVKHFLFNKANAFQIKDLLKNYKLLVIKPNTGSQGKLVFKVSSLRQLNKALKLIFKEYEWVAVSPFEEISEEFRVVVLRKKTLLIYSKQRPTLIGDGVSKVSELMNDYEYEVDNIPLNYVPQKGEKINVSWRHNLSNGANPKLLKNKKLYKVLQDIATQASLKLNIQFATIDIVEVGGEYKILEINGTVCLTKFMQFNEENYNLAKNIYKKVLKVLFKEG